jgi:osmotically-inducible protein OsmY
VGVLRGKERAGAELPIQFGDVNVTTFKGVVQLSGFTSTKEQENRAGDIAERVGGVKLVENIVTIKQ